MSNKSNGHVMSYSRNGGRPNKVNRRVNGVDHKAFTQILNARRTEFAEKMPLLFKMRKDISPPYSHKILAIHDDHITFLNLQTNKLEDFAFPPFLTHIIQEIALSKAHLMMGGLMDVLSPEVVASMDPQQVPSDLDPFKKQPPKVSKEVQDNAVVMPDPIPHVKGLTKVKKRQHVVHKDGPFAQAIEDMETCESKNSHNDPSKVRQVEVQCGFCEKPFLVNYQRHERALKENHKNYCGKPCRIAAQKRSGGNHENSNLVRGPGSRKHQPTGTPKQVGFTTTLDEATEAWEIKQSASV